MLLDFVSGLERNRSRVYRFWLDVAFGPLAAVLLFLGSLVIMDGQLHPLLLLGALLGLVLEHLTVGVYLSKTVFFLRKFLRKSVAICAKIFIDLHAVCRKIFGVLPGCGSKPRKKMKKEGK